jgi:glutaconate CoA-transferase subunit A
LGSDLPEVNGCEDRQRPYSGKEVYVIPAIRPDVAVIHVNEVDELGNARVYGTPFWDHPMTRSAKRVLITAERLVTTDVLRLQPELTLVPGFMVEAVAIAPRGAWPGSMHPLYEIDYPAVERLHEGRPRRAGNPSRRRSPKRRCSSSHATAGTTSGVIDHSTFNL